MGDAEPTWHAALVFALTGHRRDDLGRQREPDLDVVVAELPPGARGAHVVPPDLVAGIGAARFSAVLAQLRRRLAEQHVRPVVADRPLSADERRLSAEVPPHHG